MCDWKRWIWPGIAVTALLTALSMWFLAGSIGQELADRARAALAGDDWAVIEIDGRDVRLSGMAPDEQAGATAARRLATLRGIRTVAEESVLAPLADPYRFSAAKTAEGIVLSGHAPSPRIVADLKTRAETVMPGIAVDDRLEIARGAPRGFPAFAAFAVDRLVPLSKGEALLDNDLLSISGAVSGYADYEKLQAGLDDLLPPGLSLGTVAVEPPPRKSAYRLTARLARSGLVLSGDMPSAAARDALLDWAGSRFPGFPIDQHLTVMAGAPDHWQAYAARAVETLAELSSGSVAVEGDRLSVSGQAPDAAARDVALALIADLPTGLTSKSIEITALAREWVWRAEGNGDAVILAGAVPDAGIGATIVARAGRMFGAGNVIDRQTVGEGAPDGFADAAVAALQAASRLAGATAVISAHGSVRVTGRARTAAAKDEIGKRLSAAVPAGFSSYVYVAGKPDAGSPLDPAECRTRFDALLSANTIYFDPASARLDADSRGLLDRLAGVASACNAVSIEIAGHTDSDGEAAANLVLSEQRARAVLDYLAAAGVDTAMLSAKGYGEDDPAAPNDTPENKARNRRIEFRVGE